MNCSTYIFGELLNGYTQYPEDSSSNFFKSLQSQCLGSSQLIIHRDENLMYYIYIRKIDTKRYIGFATAINGYYLTQIEQLLSIFETEIEILVESGIIIHLDNNGELTSNLVSLRKEEEEVLSVVTKLHEKVANLETIKRLPPKDYTVSVKSQKIFKHSDTLSDIIDASYRYGYTIIVKEEDYDTLRFTSFKNTLKKLNADKISLVKTCEKLKEENKKIQRQKKQFKNVVLLFLICVACGIGLYFLSINLNNTQERLNQANNTIQEKESDISSRNDVISNLRDSITGLQSDLSSVRNAKNNIESDLQDICRFFPFVVTECAVSADKFSFDYYSTEEKEVTVTLKAINEQTDEIISNNHTLKYYKGNGTKNLDFYQSLDASYYYNVVLIYEGHIIAGKRW